MIEERTATTKNRWVWIVPAGIAVLIANVAIHILYMVVYGYLINPGQDEAHYRAHAEFSAPYSSIIVGMPLMFFVCRWIGRKFEPRLSITAALCVWVVYFLIDISIVVLAGGVGELALLVALSLVTKLAAAYLGGLAARKKVARV